MVFGGPYSLASVCLFDIFSLFFKHFLIFFDTVKYSRLSLDLPSPSAGISHFFKELWIFLMESDIYGRSQDLGTTYSHCLLRSRHFQAFLRTEEGNIDMYIYTNLLFLHLSILGCMGLYSYL